MRPFILVIVLALAARGHAAPELALQLPHTGAISRAVLSPSGQTIAAVSEDDGALKLWDARTGEVRYSFQGSWNSDIAFSRDGRELLTSEYQNLRIWDALSGQLRRQWKVDRGIFSPDSKRLAVPAYASGESFIEIYRTSDGEKERALSFVGPDAKKSFFTVVAWSPDGKTLAGARRGGSVALWNVADGALLKSIDFRPGDFPLRGVDDDKQIFWIDALAFSPDGKWLAAASGEGATRVAQIADGRVARKLVVSTKPNWVQNRALLWTRDSQFLLGATEANAVRVWDVARGKLTGHLKNTQGAKSLDFSRDGQTLLIGGFNPGLALWNADPLTPRKQFPDVARWRETIYFARASPDARFLTLAPYNGVGALWDWQILTRRTLPPGAGVWVPGSSLIVGAQGDALEWRRVPDGAIWKRQSLKTKRGINAIAAAPDGKTLAIFSDGEVTLRAARTGQLLRALPPREGAATAVEFSPDGQFLAAGGDDEMGWGDERGTVTLWNLRDPKSKPRVLAAHIGVQSLAWSRDSKTLAVGCGNEEGNDSWGEIQLWDARAGQLQRYLLGHAGPVGTLDWSGPDLLAASRVDVKAWRLPKDLQSAGQTRPVWTHDTGATKLVARGANFVLVRYDGTIEVRRRTDNALRATLISLPAPRNAYGTFLERWVLWTPDGYYTGSPDCERWIRWRENGKLWPAAKFAARFRRPDLVRAILSPGGFL